MKDRHILFIQTISDLNKFAQKLDTEHAVGVDVEADSMYHFRERVCLIQMQASDVSVIIDPLAVKDLSALKPMFSNPDIRKIFHGSDYDVRSLYRDFGIEIINLFDTQLASRFLGEPETSLEAVIHKRFGVILDKKYQKRDWSERPLPDEMIEYAVSDVAYLIPLAALLRQELEDKARLSWIEEECAQLSRVRTTVSETAEPLFLKFKGAGRLRPRSLAILEALLHLRTDIAQKKDRPPFKVFNSESLSEIVRTRPLTIEMLKNLNVLSSKQIIMYGNEIISAVKAGLAVPDPELPVYPRHKPPVIPPKVPKRIKALKLWRDEIAANLGIDPALICNKSLMNTIAMTYPRDEKDLEAMPELKDWQRQAFGQEIVGILKKTK